MQTILVVEDDLSIAEVVTDILEETGYQVVAVENGKAALVYLDQETGRPNMILSDIMMPVMDGRELCERLNRDAKYNSIPIVLMSAAYGSVSLDGCKHSAFLGKPFGLQELLTVVSRAIGGG